MWSPGTVAETGGKVSFTVDMQTTWSNFVHCRTAKSKIARMLDLDRDIHMAKRDPFAFLWNQIHQPACHFLSCRLRVASLGDLSALQRKRAKIQRELSDVERAGILAVGGENENDDGAVDAGYSSSSNSGVE